MTWATTEVPTVKRISGISLILASLLTLTVLGSGVEAVPEDASWWCWAGIWFTSILAILVGLLGIERLES
jgi:hypothetical protein